MANGGPRPAPGTLTQLFFQAAEQYDKPDALQVKIGGRYEPISHRSLLERVRHVSYALREIGVNPGDRVAIISENRPEWVIADFACLTSGLTDVSVYPTLPESQIAYILRDSGAAAAFVSTADQARKLASIRAELPALRCVISFDAVEAQLADVSMAEFERSGAQAEPSDAKARHRERALGVRPEEIATFLYTSGTTGEAKGVMLTHDNIHSNVVTSMEIIPFAGSDVALSFLPLSHIFERMAGYYLMFATGTSIAYAESTATVPENMLEVHPTLMVSVPRLYEKMYARVIDTAASGSAIKKRIFSWARGIGEKWADVKLANGTPRGLLAVQYSIAQRLVFTKLKERTGGQLRYFVSGGAPLSPEINKFFYAAGLTILEGYGLTETSPVIAVNKPSAFRIGTVGMAIPGVSIGVAEDGEILTSGPNVMAGYYNKPAMTAEAIDTHGWFHTGDIGELTDGFLTITDRKKDLLVTAGGKNVAPQPIEARMKQSKFVAEAVLIGDRRKFPMALVVPEFGQLEKWARYKSLNFTDHESLIALPEVRAKMERETLSGLTDLARFEMPKKIALLAAEFTVDSGELTPTLKVKRRVVDQHYKHLIDAVYADADASGSAPLQSH
ncbi:MAG TPA: long-chain fatty acid--CoA ligase [Gemmatimonadaceae bacterium]